MSEEKKPHGEFEPIVKFWNKSKGKIAVGAVATSVALVAIMRAQQSTVNQFHEKNGLTEAFKAFIAAEDED